MTHNNPMVNPVSRDKMAKTMAKLFSTGQFTRSLDKGWVSTPKTLVAIWCRSGLEKEFLSKTKTCSNILFIESAENIIIPYLYKDKVCRYLPDFKVVLNDLSCMIVEVKSSYFQSFERSKRKEEALKAFCLAREIDCFILDEKEIDSWLERLEKKKLY